MRLIYKEHLRRMIKKASQKICDFFLTPLYMNIFKRSLLANSANTNCRPFQLNNYCFEFIKVGLQQRCHMILLVSFFVTSRNFLSAKKNYYSLAKNKCHWKGVLLSVRVLEYFGKIL